MRGSLFILLCATSCGTSSKGTPVDSTGSDDSSGPPDTSAPHDTDTGESTPEASALRTRLRFTTDWSVFQGTPDGSPWDPSFDASAWQPTTLPHNPTITEGEPDPARTCYPDYAYEGSTWYRRDFDVPAEYSGHELALEFEAAGTVATVWLNGTEVLTHRGGYLPFVVELDGLVTAGSTGNVVVVHVDNTDDPTVPPGNSGWFNWGGLYRDVWFTATPPVHISNPITAGIPAGGGVSVWTSQLDEDFATLRVDTHLLNESEQSATLRLESALLDEDGTVLVEDSASLDLEAGAANTIAQALLVEAPHAWHPDDPYLHRLRSRVYDGEQLIDEVQTRVGIRSISFSQDSGLTLNGTPFWFRGANRMQDYPHVGYAAPDRLQAHDATLLKKAGLDYIRTSSYPQDPAFLDACDELGLLVMAPIPGFQFVGDDTFIAQSQDDMRQLIRRDRNRPSVIAWELSLNETNFDLDFAREAVAIGHEECPHDDCYVSGWIHDEAYDLFIATPSAGARTYTGTKPFIVSEYGHWEYGGASSRTDVSRSDGDWAMADQSWFHMEGHHLNRSLPYASGDGLWVGIDMACYPSGVLDTFRLPKFSAAFFASQRSAATHPSVFIASHWTNASKPVVTVFGSCDEVDLYLDDAWVETQTPYGGYPTDHIVHPPFYFVAVPNVRGTLRADCRIDGAIVASHAVRSPGESTSLNLRATFTELRADGSDMSFVYAEVLDVNGTVVPTSEASVRFSVTGGTLASPATVTAEAGVATAIVRAGETVGELVVTARIDGLGEQQVAIPMVAVDDLF